MRAPRAIIHLVRPTLLLIAALCLLITSVSSISYSSSSSASESPQLAKRQLGLVGQQEPHFTCVVAGDCNACSALQIQTEESCKETHNRQRIDCKYDDPKNNEDEELKIRLPTYRACLHVKAIEARRFAHFFSTNVFLAFFAGVLMVWRKRKLAAAQYRRMARRIGIA